MIVRDFELKDLETIKAIEPFMDLPPNWESVKDSIIGITAIENGKPIGCGGVVVGEEGVFWARLDGTISSDGYRALVEGVKILTDSLGDMVYSTLVLEGFRKGRRLVEKLGFRKTDTTVEHDNHIYHRYVL